MSLPFFFHANLQLEPNILILNEDASRHIIQVLRMKQGAMIQLTDGAGLNVIAEIIDDSKKKCAVRKCSTQFIPPAEKKIAIAISPIKNSGRFEWFLEKATEIGITEIIPIICSRTEKQQFRQERMNNILISAMLQSGQSYLPKLHEPTLFSSVLTSGEFQLKLIAHCNEDAGKQSLKMMTKKNSVLVLIGPEGDFTNGEVTMAISNNFLPVSLGVNRLRTETAGVVATTLLNQLMSE